MRTEGRKDAFLVAWSTCTLPGIFECPGDQRKVIGMEADLHAAMCRCTSVMKVWREKRCGLRERESNLIKKGLVEGVGEEENCL